MQIMRLSTVTESQQSEIALSAEFTVPEEFTPGGESNRLLDLFRSHANKLPEDWYLRKNRDKQNVLYWAINFNQVQLTIAILDQLSLLQQFGRVSLQSFLDDHKKSKLNLLALAFNTSGANSNNARKDIINELLNRRNITEPLLDHENRLENEREQGSLHIAAVHGVLSVFQKLQEWHGEGLAQWLQKYQKTEKDSLTPLDLAIESANVEMVKILIGSYESPKPTWDERASLWLLPGSSILHVALVDPSPNLEIVKLIMAKYPNLLSYYDKDSKTPLMELRNKIAHRELHRTDPMPTGDAEKMRNYLETWLFRSDWSISKINRSLGLELEGCEYFIPFFSLWG
jgi:hypothetical protein